jgi:hypothetical protein
MGHQLDSQAIENRLREIREAISALQGEADELAVALRVFERFSAPKSPSKEENNGGKLKLGPARPKGIPTNFEMTEMILKASEREGKNGLGANEIVEQIGSRYWPGVVGAQILPVIYHFAKQGRIRKTAGGKFKSIHKTSEGPNASASEPS